MAALRSFDDEQTLIRARDAWAAVVDTLRWRGIRSGSAIWDRETLRTAEDKLRDAEHALTKAAKDKAA